MTTMRHLRRLLPCSVPCLLLTLGLATAARASQYRDAPAPVGIEVSRPGMGGEVISGCIEAAASAHRLSPVVLVILLNVEGGQLGRVSGNLNTTVDIGPMQVNEIWLPELARHWRASIPATFLALRDNFCANVEAGAWILRKGLDEARGDFWGGVGFYHSHTSHLRAAYLRKVLSQALRLQAMQDRAQSSLRSTPGTEQPGIDASLQQVRRPGAGKGG